jgi:hypothetical protein
MARWFDWIRRKPAAFEFIDNADEPRLVLARSCFDGLLEALAPANHRRHEGVALLLGKIHEGIGVAAHAVRPNAVTTGGSFSIPGREMARVVGVCTRLGLDIIGQVHTHPLEAFHSEGDEEGANIRYDGYFSLVIPEYGRFMPSFQGSTLYVFSANQGWRLLDSPPSVVDALTAL